MHDVGAIRYGAFRANNARWTAINGLDWRIENFHVRYDEFLQAYFHASAFSRFHAAAS